MLEIDKNVLDLRELFVVTRELSREATSCQE